MNYRLVSTYAQEVCDKGQELLLANTDAEHFKFWRIKLDPNNPAIVLTHNGRLGTKGQVQKPKNTLSKHNAHTEVRRRIEEKLNKGYHRVTERELEKLNTRAAVVGTQNKCGELSWVERIATQDERINTYQAASDLRLAEPSYDPILLVHVQTRKVIDGRNDFVLLFTPEHSYELTNYKAGATSLPWIGEPVLLTKTHQLYELSEKVEAALGYALS